MAHAQKPDFVFRGNGPVQLNRRGRQFGRLLAAEVCALAVVTGYTVFRGSVKSTGYPLHSPLHLPSHASTVCQHMSTGCTYSDRWALNSGLKLS
jgi:hypothetical protein